MIQEEQIKIAIAEDHLLVREGLVKQLVIDKDITVIMEARHGLDMLGQLEKAEALPDIAIIDLSMPVMDGFTLSVELRKKFPSVKILVLSAYCSEYNVAIMINNGICGYLQKDTSPTEFRKAIHDIYETGYYYSELANENAFKVLQGTHSKSVNIPEREMEFLKLCCTEQRYDEIATTMGITGRTLDGCRERLFDRLGINSRIALVLFAMKSGIVANEAYRPTNLKNKY